MKLLSIEIGKIPAQYVIMPKFLVRIDYNSRELRRPWAYIGRLYQGYIGAMAHFLMFEFTLWIHSVAK